EDRHPAAVGRESRLEVAARALRQLPDRAVLDREEPDVHVAGPVGVERDPLAVAGPGAPALLARRGDDLLGRAGGAARFRLDRKPPEGRVLPEDREGEPPAVAGNRRLDVLPGAGRQLLEDALGLP